MTNDHDVFGGLCRFCGLQKNCGKFIFSTEAMKIGLLTKIKILFPEDVELINCDTVLPKFICDTCETTVNYFHEFRNGVKLVQQNLQKIQHDMSNECREIRLDKTQHVCSATRKAEGLVILFNAEGFVSCFNCNAELQREEILSNSSNNKQPVCICDECGFKDKVEMFISKEDMSSGCPKCAYMKEKKLAPPDKPARAAAARAFDCEICDKSFRSKGHLNRHRLTHYGSKPFACDECGSRFNQKSSLKTHTLIHERANSFSCTWCGQQFRHKQTLANHIVGIHGVAADDVGHVYECDKCKKRFVHKEKLRRHYRSHSGEKPFKCDLCDRTFTQKVNLKTHYKKHESEGPFSGLCATELRRSDGALDERLTGRAVVVNQLVGGGGTDDDDDDGHFGGLTRGTLDETKRGERNYHTNLASAGVHMKRDADSYAQMPHSVLNDAEKGKLIQELLGFESIAAENDSLETFPLHSEYADDDSTLKVASDSNAMYFNASSSSNYIMYSSNSSLYDLDNVSQCSVLPTFSNLN